jgi:transposase-like protein
MRTIIFFAIVLALLLYLGRMLGAKLIHCPKCKRRAVEAVETTKYWKKFKCRRCGHMFVEETGH